MQASCVQAPIYVGITSVGPGEVYFYVFTWYLFSLSSPPARFFSAKAKFVLDSDSDASLSDTDRAPQAWEEADEDSEENVEAVPAKLKAVSTWVSEECKNNVCIELSEWLSSRGSNLPFEG